MSEPASDARRTRNSERTREAILAAAREVFLSDGYERASVRRIAERAACSHGTLYLHFRDKDDLLYQLSEEHFRELLARLRALPRSLDAVSRIRAAFDTVLDLGLEHPDHYHLMIATRPPHLAGRARFGPMADEVVSFLYDTVAHAAQRGAIGSDNPRLDALALLATAHGLIELHRAGVMSSEEVREAAHRGIGVMLRGLAC